MRRYAKRRCYNCRGPLRSAGRKIRFCSQRCYHASRWGLDRICRQCDSPITTRNRFCSKTCGRKYWDSRGWKAHKKKSWWARKLTLLKDLGGKCRACGNDDIRVLEINHKNRAKKTRPPRRHYNHANRMREWLSNLSNLELLCANCHRIHTWKQMAWGLTIKAV